MVFSKKIIMAAQMDVARTVLRLPCYLHMEVVLNTPQLPVYHLLVERLEAYQVRAKLTDNPLRRPIRPPSAAQSWTTQLVCYAASFEPPLALAITSTDFQHTLVTINWLGNFKFRGSERYQVRIGVGQRVVAVKLNVSEVDLMIDHYQLGYRGIDDIQSHPIGRTIPIRWSYERPSGSDIWYEWTYRRVEEEFEAAGRQRVILLESTSISGVDGVNDITLLDEALARTRMHYMWTLQDGRPFELETQCSVYGSVQLSGVKAVGAGTTHNVFGVHAILFMVVTKISFNLGTILFDTSGKWSSVFLPTGDGSVLAANSQHASGSWAIQ
ncbi:LOW QUALITY PROTEIN: hypothetical protein PHMEG_00016457 [Phytophthora megakarya]|uniref:Uncharacterized protein n=1 Tax=Phytophthora megakarya TaxID=4795 RepID=A0A225W0G9_9STRA|nr:LOW QUALITY PROTEIN: hypothetical protein PHMEG_00016457 [Phytophthora megakarya]